MTDDSVPAADETAPATHDPMVDSDIANESPEERLKRFTWYPGQFDLLTAEQMRNLRTGDGNELSGDGAGPGPTHRSGPDSVDIGGQAPDTGAGIAGEAAAEPPGGPGG